jgi:NAD(P)-dependent dehydrogenase (short-subunit alcohol dehydrogenase family)
VGATKFALEALTDSYPYELSQLGVELVLLQPSFYPTNIFASALLPADAERIAAYGEIGTIPGKMAEAVVALFQSESAPNPHDVAEAIARLVAQPAGSRPARVIVGQPHGADIVNAQATPVQAQLLAGFGLSQLGEPRQVPAVA